MNKITILLLSLPVAIACGKSADKSAAAPPPPHVVVITVAQRDQPVYREWIGTTQGDVNADIRPKAEGYLLRRAYQEGSYVRRGQLLFETDRRQAESQLEQAQANLAKSEHDVQRFEPLAAQKALSQQELDNARSALSAAKATVGALQAAVDQARLNVSWTRVTSPISGIAGDQQSALFGQACTKPGSTLALPGFCPSV